MFSHISQSLCIIKVVDRWIGGAMDAKSTRERLHCVLPILLFAWAAAIPGVALAEPPAIYRLGPVGTNSIGYAVNASGQVTGETEPGGINHAFLSTGTLSGNGMMFDLGTLGGTNSQGNGINSIGQVVGNSQTASGITHAFLYTGTPARAGQ